MEQQTDKTQEAVALDRMADLAERQAAIFRIQAVEAKWGLSSCLANKSQRAILAAVEGSNELARIVNNHMAKRGQS